MSAGFPEVRPRRLRGTKALRAMVAETALRPAELVLPVFVKEGLADPRPISSMPGVVQHTRDSLRKAAAELGIARSTAHRLLAMLVYRDFAVRTEDRCYRPGPALSARPLPGEPAQRLRAAFRGRAIHTSLETWTAQVEAGGTR